ncbi:MAG TPA: TAT-variant-translocated molybdopterin oxidoreductase [Pseudolabrys sp.]|nr:TAT-variant-translocated molybdopterin oxidoreductase [Pseudolabrys sp.]
MRAENLRFDLPRLRDMTRSSRRFWSSLEELIDEEGFRAWLAAEFPAASSMFDDPGRRQFLKLMGASLLLAGLGGCRDGKSGEALPYVNQPEGVVPGVPRYYATAVTFEGYAQPVIAATYAGRPTKLDGNPDHPVTRGASDAFMQSAVFELYDPQRSKLPLKDGVPSTWGAATAALTQLRARWQERRGEGLRILTGATTSPTLIRQMAELTKQFPKMRWSQSQAIGTALQDEAMTLAFGRPITPHYQLDKCDLIVSLDHDLLGPGPHQVARAKAWAEKRGEAAPGAGRARLHAAECLPSLTGAVADSRLPCDASRVPLLAQAIAAKFGVAANKPELNPHEEKWLARAIDDLRNHAGASLFTIGPQHAPAIQALAPAVNQALKNAGLAVWYSEPILAPAEPTPLAKLAAEISAGSVDTLIMLDCNPVYDAPAGLQFAELIARVPNRVHAGLHVTETSHASQWHLPLSHALEAWSDGRAIDGSAIIGQPVVAPLYDTRSVYQLIDFLLGGSDPKADNAVRATWRERFGDQFDARWRKSLHDGFVDGTTAKPLTLSPKAPHAEQRETADQYEIVFLPDPTIWDGRFANIAWLQELPKPLTKITWDNVIAISPAIAAREKLSNGDVVDIDIGARSVRGPVWIVPGQGPRTIALFLGYGRRAGGDIGQGVGYDAYAVRPAENAFIARGRLSRAPDRPQQKIASTQAHHRMDGFDFVREVTATNPRTAPPKDTPTLYPDWNEIAERENRADHAWGMVIDLDLCIGCNACVSACNVENNVVVVGKDQVSRGREMAWLRVDRYYSGDVENPKSYFQPVPCMHCEKAPCEMGCPVHATAHSPEGVNQMVYNRCIGTRTCSSYCPYKVRRFNWYDYRNFAEAEQAVKNPDVTVRSRGVMEKCSYCTQRIQAAHVAADKEDRALRRDEVTTACQQACPTTAIVFGDLLDRESAVAKRRQSGRHYVLLEELGTRPRTTYLARWRDEPGEESA